MFAKLLSIAALVAAANAEHWIFGGSRPIITTRLDLIVNSGGVCPLQPLLASFARIRDLLSDLYVVLPGRL